VAISGSATAELVSEGNSGCSHPALRDIASGVLRTGKAKRGPVRDDLGLKVRTPDQNILFVGLKLTS